MARANNNNFSLSQVAHLSGPLHPRAWWLYDYTAVALNTATQSMKRECKEVSAEGLKSMKQVGRGDLCWVEHENAIRTVWQRADWSAHVQPFGRRRKLDCLGDARALSLCVYIIWCAFIYYIQRKGLSASRNFLRHVRGCAAASLTIIYMIHVVHTFIARARP